MIQPTGYDKLARFMVNDQYALFRQFKSSANRDLLFLQAELVQLEEEFVALSERVYDRNWYLLSSAKYRGCGGEQWEKALQIRAKLREYYEFASRYSEMISKPRARKRDLKMLRAWISRPDLGGGIAFTGNDLNLGAGSAYDDEFLDDLIALNNSVGENDPFTRFLAGTVFHKFEKLWRYFKKPIPSDPENLTLESNLFHYSNSHIFGVIELFGTVLSSLTPLLSIIILYFVGNLGYRLAILCACSLALVTKARRIEVFAATAAFASVQVVFVGTTNNQSYT